MNKTLICLFITLFVCCQAATQAPLKSDDFGDELLKILLKNFTQAQQAKNNLPQGNFTIVFLDTFAYNHSGFIEYNFKITLNSTVVKDSFLIEIKAKIDPKSRNITATQSKINFCYHYSEKHNLNVSIATYYITDFDYQKYLKLINNDNITEGIFANSLKVVELPNIYFKPSGHRVSSMYLDTWYGFKYEYVNSLQNLLTGDVHDEILKLTITDQEELYKGHVPSKLYATRHNVPSSAEPFVDPKKVNQTNSTKLTYNPLAFLWNLTLLEEIREKAQNITIQDVKDAYGKDIATGRFEHKKGDKFWDFKEVATRDSGLVFTVSTVYVTMKGRNDIHHPGKVILQLNPINKSISIISHCLCW